MKKLILSTAALVTLGLTPAFAEEAVTTEAVPAIKAETAVTTEATTTTTAPAAAEAAELKTIADLAVADAELSTLVSALTAAELTESLKGTGPFTVFAPTNDAFKKLDPAVLADLLKPENKEKLAAVLKYHVVPGKIASADAKGADVDLTTLNGAVVKVDGKGAVVKVGEATVTKADIAASNGVIHVIDTVILPPEKDAAKTDAVKEEVKKH
jgi:uncharacterized surface protein with fasciclin (FAS1) repeats